MIWLKLAPVHFPFFSYRVHHSAARQPPFCHILEPAVVPTSLKH